MNTYRCIYKAYLDQFKLNLSYQKSNSYLAWIFIDVKKTLQITKDMYKKANIMLTVQKSKEEKWKHGQEAKVFLVLSR